VEARSQTTIDEHAPVILAGFGRFGNFVGRFMMSQGVKVTVLESDPDHVEMLRAFGFKVFYGDATRLDLLHAAGIAEALHADHRAGGPVRRWRGSCRRCGRNIPMLRILVRAHMTTTSATSCMKLGLQRGGRGA
jgi:hypothetical protein